RALPFLARPLPFLPSFLPFWPSLAVRRLPRTPDLARRFDFASTLRVAPRIFFRILSRFAFGSLASFLSRPATFLPTLPWRRLLAFAAFDERALRAARVFALPFLPMVPRFDARFFIESARALDLASAFETLSLAVLLILTLLSLSLALESF